MPNPKRKRDAWVLPILPQDLNLQGQKMSQAQRKEKEQLKELKILCVGNSEKARREKREEHKR